MAKNAKEKKDFFLKWIYSGYSCCFIKWASKENLPAVFENTKDADQSVQSDQRLCYLHILNLLQANFQFSS